MELIDRIEAAEKGSRELDAEIARTQGWSHFFHQKDMWWKSPDGRTIADAPRFTTSLDAAMSLEPEGWVAFNLSSHDCGIGCFACYTMPDGTVFAGKGVTRILAICAASLRSRHDSGG